MALRNVPFQLPRTRSTVAATLQRLAGGGAPAKQPKPAPYVAPQNPPTVTPYKGDMAHYGEGPEWDFFQTPAPLPPPVVKPPTTGGGGGGDPSHPFGGDGSGSRNPWNQGGGSGGTDPSHPFGGDGSGSRNPWNQPGGDRPFGGDGSGSRNPWNNPPTTGGGNTSGTPSIPLPTQTGPGGINVGATPGLAKLLGVTPGAPVTHQTPGFESTVDGGGINTGPITGLGAQLGVTTPGAVISHPAVGPDTVNTGSATGLLKMLGVAPQVTGGGHQTPAVMPAQPALPTAPLATYLQNLGAQPVAKPRVQAKPQTNARTGTTGGGSPRNMAIGGAVDPGAQDSAAQAIASLREAPWEHGEQRAGGYGQNVSGQDKTNADVAVNPSLKSAISIGSMVAGLAMSPVAGALMSAAKLGYGALTGQPMSDPFDVPGPRLTADQIQAAQDAYNNTAGPLTNRVAAYNNSIENSRTVDRGGQLGGAGPGLSAGIGVDSAGHTYASNIGGAGVSHNLAGRGASAAGDGGDRAGEGYGGQGGDVGSGRGDMGAGEGPDKGGLYASGGRIRHLAKGGLPRFPSIRRFADGGAMDASNQFLDASSQSMAQPMPAASDTNNSSGFSTELLPLIAGAYSAQNGGPLAGAASLGAATAMVGGTMQQALDSATLLYQSGASQQPHAQHREYDPGHGATAALLASLAQQAGIANQLRASANDPSGTMAADNAPMGYSKPAPRTAHAEGGNIQGHGARSTGHSYAVKGAGTGQSDDIEARLSNDEHVWDATTVAALGDGSSDAGHRRLDQMREMIRAKAGMKNPKKIMGKQPDVGKILARVSGGRV